jgi:carbamoyl-phosphate synthase large subunit
MGYGLYELPNSVTHDTSAFFEPALDYCVVKIPRWDMKKFSKVSRKIGTGMKSVGEIMAIGRNFEEALQKGLRMLEIGSNGIVCNPDYTFEDIDLELTEPTEERVFAISEHVENAGVHSGDATLVIPPQRTYLETIRRIRNIAKLIALHLDITGPFNMQFIAKNNEVKVIECNLRASRSFPFVSKVMKQNFIDVAAKAIMRVPVKPFEKSFFELDYVGVKAPQFSFNRLIGADPTLGVEMASTGEVGCLGDTFDEAFLKALVSVGYNFNIKNVLLSTGPIESKADMLEASKILLKNGAKLYATGGTAKFLQNNEIPVETLYWPLDKKHPDVIDYIKEGKIDLVINIPKNYRQEELTNGYLVRRAAVDYNVNLITNKQIALRFIEAIGRKSHENLKIRSWSEY